MLVFWIVAGALASASAALVISRAASAGRAALERTEDPAMPVYRRHLSELDEQADRGLLGAEEHRAARAEAARRLLSAADRQRASESGDGKTPSVVAIAAAGAGTAALLLYMMLGSPGMQDAPYRARVHAWRRADPATLGAQEMAAVLQDIAVERPRDPQVYDYLGRAELAAGDAFAAARAFEHGAALAPQRVDLKLMQGEALLSDGDGQVSPEAEAAFRQTLALDPHSAPAKFYVGQALIARGRVGDGLSLWRQLSGELPRDDPRRAPLQAQIERVAAGGARGGDVAPGQAQNQNQTRTQTQDQIQAEPAPTPDLQAQAPGQMAFIQAMVARQAAALQAQPDDPQGWARLVRSYGVLKDRAAQASALTTARRLFRDRPSLLAPIEAQAAAAPAD